MVYLMALAPFKEQNQQPMRPVTAKDKTRPHRVDNVYSRHAGSDSLSFPAACVDLLSAHAGTVLAQLLLLCANHEFPCGLLS